MSQTLQIKSPDSSKAIRVGIIFHRFGPYHVVRLTAAAMVCDVTAIELSGNTREYAWDKIEDVLPFARVTIFPEGDSRRTDTTIVVNRLAATLEGLRQDVVAVPGWSDKAALAAMRWCLMNRTPVIVMSESSAHDEPRVWWKEWAKRRLVGLCSAALVGGQLHSKYLARLGMSDKRIFTGYDVVDNEYFARKADESRDKEIENRNCYHLPQKYFLASARFIAKKNLSTLIRAYARYRSLASQSDAWDLVILGDGPLKSDLCRTIADLSLEAHVSLPGFKQYHELPIYYGLAKAFIHTSTTEQWGLVVNEAMASGLPVVVSNSCGCAIDLVQEGQNGFTFDPTDINELTGLMTEVAAHGFPLASFASESRRTINRFSAGSFGEGLRQAIKTALSESPPRLGLLDRLLLQFLITK